MELRDNFVQATAERVVSANLKELKRLRRNWPGNSPTVRVTPTEGQVWQRYCYCVITPQQPISEEFWEKLENDPGWDSLSDRDRKKAPLKGFTASVLGRNDVRFASHKATLIRKGWNRDATAIAKKMRNVLAANHDSNKKAAALRECERSLASEIVRESQWVRGEPQGCQADDGVGSGNWRRWQGVSICDTARQPVVELSGNKGPSCHAADASERGCIFTDRGGSLSVMH